MGTSTSLIIGFVNFLVLCAIAYWAVGSNINQFFHRRRSKIQKQMFDSVLSLRQARTRSTKSQERYEGLPTDIEFRKEAISRNCEKECRNIIADAHERAEHIMKAGQRRAEKERKRHAILLRERLMRAAFRMAEERIRKNSAPGVQRRYLDRGLEELSESSESRD